MKKQLTTLAYISFACFSAFAQPQLNANGFFDDFSLTADYVENAETGRGIYWWNEANQTITRNPTNKSIDVVMTQANRGYVPFGVGFGDSNGEAAGGTPYTIDISKNGKFSFDITNHSTKEDISIRIVCIDVQNRQVSHNSPVGGYVFNDNWRYQMQVLVPMGQTVTFTTGSPNGEGTLNAGDFVGGNWADYGSRTGLPEPNHHPIRTDCDLTQIKGINLTVLNASKPASNDYHNLALTDGNFSISNFKVGDVTPTGLIESEISKERFSMFPNPAKNSINIRGIESEVGKSIQIKNSYGQVVYTAQLNSKETSIDISHLQSGLYFVGEKMQKLIVE